MKTKNHIKKTELAKKLGISHSAIVQWQNKNTIPSNRVFEIAPIIGCDPKSLWDDPNILFDLFNPTANEEKKAG